MPERFRDIKFPTTYRYSSDSDHIPLEFYEDAFPIAKEIDLLLGYFSSNAIRVLSKSFAEFIINGGKMRIITNHVYSLKDYQELIEISILENDDKIIDIFSDLKYLEESLSMHSQHFFDCLRYLMKKDRLQILPVKFNNVDLAHCKRMILFDGEEHITTEGSINFTLPALLKNSESFQVETPWNGEVSLQRIKEEITNFNKIFSGQHLNYTYIPAEQIEVVIHSIGKDKDIKDLLDDSLKLGNDIYGSKVSAIISRKKERFEARLEEIINTPRFPFEQGPRDYQIEAYNEWVNNGYKGIFAMATGTGKTLTALYCCLKEYNKNKIQKLIVVVPGEELVQQWYKELKDCNFQCIFRWSSKNSNLKNDKKTIKDLRNYDKLCIVTTYDSFKSDGFSNVLGKKFYDYIVIFDEAHNMGASGFRNKIKAYTFLKVIGLSATPLRMWDEEGENDFIENFFNSKPPYTYNFSMDRAIKEEYLCPYHYYPYFSYLTHAEWEEYLDLTRRIPLAGENETINSKAALKRQLLIDQSTGKISVSLEIIQHLLDSNNQKFTLIYAPKGENGDGRIIKEIGKKIGDVFNAKINTQFFLGETKNRPELLKLFEYGEVEMLLAIKCLDEGVNIPATQNAVFIASGKNYREFIQRRGRILRNFKTKKYKKEHANIYDIICLPTTEQFNSHQDAARKMIINEFKRVFEFYKLAKHNTDSNLKLDNKLLEYNLSRNYIENQYQQ